MLTQKTGSPKASERRDRQGSGECWRHWRHSWETRESLASCGLKFRVLEADEPVGWWQEGVGLKFGCVRRRVP